MDPGASSSGRPGKCEFSWQDGSDGSDFDGRLRWLVRIDGPELQHVEDAEASDSDEVFQFLLKLLPKDDREAVTKFVFLEDRKRTLVSRLMARRCAALVSGESFHNVKMARTKGKKPFTKSPPRYQNKMPNFNFNISHEGNYVALASEPYAVVGIDVAAPSQFRRRGQGNQSGYGVSKEGIEAFFRDLKGSFGESEWNVIHSYASDEQKLAAFRRFWSCKEAFVKARGDGLGFPLERCVFDQKVVEDVDGDDSLDFEPEVYDATVKIYPKKYLGEAVETNSKWRLRIQKVDKGGHYITVARGPLSDIIDAWGEFSDTLTKKAFSDDEWRDVLSAPHPVFESLSLTDLVPEPMRAKFSSLIPSCIM